MFISCQQILLSLRQIDLKKQSMLALFFAMMKIIINRNYINIMKDINWSTQISMGQLTLKNRVVMAALTRTRCNPQDGIPTQLVAKYYGQRAGAGMCITESSAWSPRGIGFQGAGNIFTQEQAEGWKKVVQQVHKNKGLLFLQMFHAGRATSLKINSGYEPWAPSSIAIRRQKLFLNGESSYAIPKQMTLQDIQKTKESFEQSVRLSKKADFDGLQLHGANGYLIDQFIRSYTNRRNDKYGGSAQNRCRFVLELIDIALKYYQPFRIGIKLSPVLRFNDMFDDNPLETYSFLLKELNVRKIGFVQLVESQQKQYGTECYDLHISSKQQIQNVCKSLRSLFDGIIIGNCGFTSESGLENIRKGDCDAISFGIYYISNPDLAERIINSNPLNLKLDPSTFDGRLLQDKSKGYTDYPFYEQQAKLG